MSVNMTTATSVRPAVLFRVLATTSDVTIYAPSGFGAQILSCNFVNQTSSAATVTLTVIKAGGALSDGIAYMFEDTVPAKGSAPGVNRQRLTDIVLDEGDFISVKASANNAIAITATGFEYGGSGTILTGIQDDSVGDPGYATNATSVDAKCDVGNGPNRLLAAAMIVAHESGTASYAAYDTLGMACGSGTTSMGTPKVSVNFNQGGNLNGSVHLFALSGPAASLRHTVRGSASKAGVPMDILVIPMSLTGVASVSGFSSTGPSTSAALSLPVTTGVGNRVIWAGGFNLAPRGLKAMDGTTNRGRLRGFDGSPAVGFTVPHWGALIDAVGVAGALTLQTSAADYIAAVGMNCVPA